MDNIVFSKEITEAKNCEVKPAFAAPASCDVGQFECPSDHSCINIVRTHILIRNTLIYLIKTFILLRILIFRPKFVISGMIVLKEMMKRVVPRHICLRIVKKNLLQDVDGWNNQRMN